MDTSSKKYLQYLAGLAAAAIAAPALASPPPRPRLVDDQVKFSANVADKVAAAESSAWWPYFQFPYVQSFGEVWVEYGFIEVQPPRPFELGIAAMTPSEAFARVRNS